MGAKDPAAPRPSWSRARAVLPFLSLAIGVASAVFMKRTPERAWMVAIAAFGSFVTLAGFVLLTRTPEERLAGTKKTLLHLSHYALAASTQSMIQLNLFFALPLYWQASSNLAVHGVYLGLLAAAGLLTLWDPLYGWWIRSGFRGAALQAVAIFAGLNCALPMLGLSNRLSLAVSTGAAALALPLLELVARLSTGRTRLARLFGFVAVPAALALGAAVLIPPAPLRMVEGGIGTSVTDRHLEGAAPVLSGPSQLVCATAVAAPRGLTDALFHVWSKDGVPLDRIRLEISGGREEGYRTWSIKRNLGERPTGRWSCRTETALGQRLGEVEVRID